MSCFHVHRWLLEQTLLAAHLVLFLSFPSLAQDADALRQEEVEDYFTKWLKEDVVYIITLEEKAVFTGLHTPDEKEQFIEQFWFRRDPDPATATNEFREEHYRRIAYANENFQSGWPGWMTDRGRVYIIHGPPVEIERHAQGERYDRPMHEGGGTTSTYAYETWRYRFVDRIGSDVVIEFVDDSFTGEYRLASSAQQKDALLHIAEQGLTLHEQMGGSRDDQAYLPDDDALTSGMLPDRETLFGRMNVYRQIMRPQELQYRDLQKFITVDISYEQVPIKLQADYVRLNEQRTIVPITVEIENKNISFVDRDGRRMGGVVLYGIVTGLTGEVYAEFEHDLATFLSPDNLDQQTKGRSLYQKVLVLDNNSRYKLDLVVQDMNSSSVGVIQKLLAPTKLKEDELGISSVILSTMVQRLTEAPDTEEMFVLGDVRIVPKVDHVFPSGSSLNVYFQVYGATLDQSSLSPRMDVSYEITRSGEGSVLQILDQKEESLYTFSSQRLIFIREIDTRSLPPGSYSLKVRAHDRIADQTVSAEKVFEIQGG